jgi:hypothetical protein
MAEQRRIMVGEREMSYSEYANPGGVTTTKDPGHFQAQTHIADVIDGTISSLQNAVERINSIEYRLARLADRYVGSRPTPMPTIDKSAPVNPTVQMLLGDLGGAVERLFTELDRLNDAR